MSTSEKINLEMEALGKKITTDIVFYDDSKPKKRKKIDRRKLNHLTKEIRKTLVYAK